MATFISTVKLTGQGLKAIKETTKRATAIKTAMKKMGITHTATFWTLGAYDGLLIFDAPDDETATAVMLQIASQGNNHTSTVRAFTAGEMDKILDKISGRGK